MSMGIEIGAAGQNGDQAALEAIRMIDPRVVEATAHLWLVLMYVAGAVMFLSGIVALNNLRALRGWNIAAATGILISTALTLAGIWVLIRWGGFPPTIKPLAYLIIIAVQSGFGWVLLVGTLVRSR